ncbi:sunset domain-containing protein [Lapidilactobacillus wuchangensis]|uniref:sunset domain-containing protein n=1 Tax=Lapidilactobacillus wuchangensis TaxID=2486001 RepID=UPI000F7B3CBE|nr:hypothetical protein [Lapidilactobacillus wuchangensis]
MSNFFVVLFLLAIIMLIFVPARALVKRHRHQATAFVGLSTSKWLIGLSAVTIISVFGAGMSGSQTSQADQKHYPIIAEITPAQHNKLSKRAAGLKNESSDLSKEYALAKSTSKSLSAEADQLSSNKETATAAASSEASSISSSKVAAEEASKQAAAAEASRAAASSKAAADQAAAQAAANAAATTTAGTGGGGGAQGDVTTGQAGQIIGNSRSKIYHVPGQAGYHMSSANTVYFNSEQEAQARGYRKALR